VFSGRGCGGVPLTTPKIFCQADTADVYVSVREIRSQFPQAAIFAIGFSLGGYTLNKYLGQVDTAVYGPGQHTQPHVTTLTRGLRGSYAYASAPVRSHSLSTQSCCAGDTAHTRPDRP
jgi:predicted alpha/beta-fold hydrolase